MEAEREEAFPKAPEHREHGKQEQRSLDSSIDPDGSDHGPFNCD